MSATPIASSEIPVLESARLRLRAHRTTDFSDMCALWSDPAVIPHTVGRPSTPEEVWTRLLRYAGHWALLGYGYWVIEEKSSGAFAGEIGFADYKRAIDPPLSAPEAGWALAPRVHGKGYATEAVNTILAWGDRHLAADRTVCIITPANTASIRVAQKCGYQEKSTVSYHDKQVLLFERLRP